MKVLFLDIDGVLNCPTTTEKVGRGPFAAFLGLDARLVGMLRDWLAENPDVKIVISSSWREDKDQLDLIREAGIPFLSFTPNMKNRATEIDYWLTANPEVTAYAILDDIEQFNDRQRPHFVRTSYEHGLREKDLRALEVILS